MWLYLHNRYISDYVKRFNLKITCNTRVVNIKKEKTKNGGEEFVLRTQGGPTNRAQVVIMACGAMKEKLPNIPGIELVTTYGKHSTRQEDYENKKICIVVGGNSGFEVDCVFYLISFHSCSIWVPKLLSFFVLSI